MKNSSRLLPLRFPFAYTYSIVARDPKNGQMGVAVQSHWFSTGSMVTWAEAGVGAVATQSMVKLSYGPQGLELMRKGIPAFNALKTLLAKDEGRDVRQVAMIDRNGNLGVHTGSNVSQKPAIRRATGIRFRQT